jgi:DNA-binding response OmpR family regulator
MNKIIKNLTILYIEDDSVTREFITKSLQLMCDNVISTDTIEEAQIIYKNNLVDILISDINVGKKSGINFIKDIRNNNKQIPIILLSAHSNKNFLFEAIKLNLIDYLVKPINYESLHNSIKASVKYLIDNGHLEVEFVSGIRYSIKQKIAYKENIILQFTATELKILTFFLNNKSSILSSDEIIYHVWEDDFATIGALKSLINKLRKKIGKDSIKNHSKLGYQLVLK